MEEQETKSFAGRKRPLEVDGQQDSEDQRDLDSDIPASKVPAVNTVLDEIELHFQRSLAKVKPNQRNSASSVDSDHAPSSKPLVIYHTIEPRDSPSPNHQSRMTPPTSSSSSSSSLSSSPRRHGIGSNKPLPPPLKLASPTSDMQSSTVQSLHTYTQQHHSSRASHHQTIILPTVSTSTGLTGLSRSCSSPSAVTSLPALTISNGLPRAGTSPPSSLSRTLHSGGVSQFQTLPTISAAALSNLAAAGNGGVYQNVVSVASPQHLLSSHQQRAIQQTFSNGSSSPKRSVASVPGTPTTTVHFPTNNSGLAAVQLTPGGPLLALPSSGLQPNSSNSGSIIAPRALVTGIAGLGSGGGGGGYQLAAPSVTQPGSVHIINIPDDNSSSAGLKTSPPAPLLATPPSLPKPPTIVNVSQIPNLIAINPSSPGSPSPGNKTPTVKVLGVSASGTQSPIRVSAAATQTTPIATPTMITPQQLAANPSLMSVIDPAISSQLMAAGNTAGGPMYLIPAGGMPMVQQPFFIINPSTTHTDLQQVQQANILAANPSLAGASLVSNPAGGYLLVSPGQGAPVNFSMPFVNLASTASINSSQPAVPSLIPTSPAVTMTTLKPANMTTVLNSTTVNKPPPTVKAPPLKNQTSSDSSSSPSHTDVMMTPASVDDHFAQALGPQWNKLKSHNSMQPQQC